MKLTNLSKIGPLHVLAIDLPDGTEYWTHDIEFSKDITQANKLGTGASIHWMSKLLNRGFNVRAEVYKDSVICLMYWPGEGWVVVNHREWPSTVHRVYLNNSYGAGWFFKDEGSVERQLCMNRGGGAYLDLTVRGRDILKSTMRIEGDVMENFTAFTIPCDSDLVYQFAFDPTPLEL